MDNAKGVRKQRNNLRIINKKYDVFAHLLANAAVCENGVRIRQRGVGRERERGNRKYGKINSAARKSWTRD